MNVVDERSNTAAKQGDRAIVARRVFDAPRELVFRLWTDPHHIANWWGPKGFRNTIHKMDVRAGGEWDFVMHGPDGTDYKNRIIYREIAAPERIRYSHVSGPTFESTITFEPLREAGREQTRITVEMEFPSGAVRDQVAEQFGAVEGLSETLGRLADQLANLGTSSEFVIARTFDAPVDLVYRAWTETDRLAQWFGPKGVTIVKSNNDLRPGGMYHYGMRTPDGNTMWGRWIYREVVPGKKLVFVNSFSDEHGGLVRAPFAQTWPIEMLSVITFEEDGGGTRVTIRWTAIDATSEERATFDASHANMNQGWTGTFEQLAAYLAEAVKE